MGTSRANFAQADGQRKELQRITADNKRLYRALQVKEPPRAHSGSMHHVHVLTLRAGDEADCSFAEADSAQGEGS